MATKGVGGGTSLPTAGRADVPHVAPAPTEPLGLRGAGSVALGAESPGAGAGAGAGAATSAGGGGGLPAGATAVEVAEGSSRPASGSRHRRRHPHKKHKHKPHRGAVTDFYDYDEDTPLAETRSSSNVVSVYAGFHRESGERVAVKRIWATDPSSVAAAKLEVTMVWSVNDLVRHDAIMKYRDVFWEKSAWGDRVAFLVMPYCAGGELYDRLRAASHFTEEVARQIFVTITSAVAALHAVGIVHRDLKPQNVLLRRSLPPGADPGELDSSDLVVTDFGLSLDVHRRADVYHNVAVGTVEYLCPELVGVGPLHHGPAADIWALGVILYNLLTGRQPFQSVYDVRAAATDLTNFVDLTAVSPGAAQVVLGCLRGSPEARPTAPDLLDAATFPWVSTPLTPEAAAPLDEVPARLGQLQSRMRFRAAVHLLRVTYMLRQRTLGASRARSKSRQSWHPWLRATASSASSAASKQPTPAVLEDECAQKGEAVAPAGDPAQEGQAVAPAGERAQEREAVVTASGAAEVPRAGAGGGAGAGDSRFPERRTAPAAAGRGGRAAPPAAAAVELGAAQITAIRRALCRLVPNPDAALRGRASAASVVLLRRAVLACPAASFRTGSTNAATLVAAAAAAWLERHSRRHGPATPGTGKMGHGAPPRLASRSRSAVVASPRRHTAGTAAAESHTPADRPRSPLDPPPTLRDLLVAMVPNTLGLPRLAATFAAFAGVDSGRVDVGTLPELLHCVHPAAVVACLRDTGFERRMPLEKQPARGLVPPTRRGLGSWLATPPQARLSEWLDVPRSSFDLERRLMSQLFARPTVSSGGLCCEDLVTALTSDARLAAAFLGSGTWRANE